MKPDCKSGTNMEGLDTGNYRGRCECGGLRLGKDGMDK